MVFNFNFRSLDSTRQLKELVNFLAHQDLGYPKYQEWVGRTEAELEAGSKRAILALSDRTLVGDLIYQGHKSFSPLMELKNLRVHHDLRMREFGRFMLRQAEVEAKKENYLGTICDVRINKPEILKFMGSCGYRTLTTSPLYEENMHEAVMFKLFNTQGNLLLPQIKKKLIF